MNFSATCIKRPVLTIVLSLVLVMIGLMSFNQLSLRSQPQYFRPSIHINVQVPGSSPSFIAKNVLTPLETQLQQVPNVTFMLGTAEQGSVRVNLKFKGMTQSEFLTAQSDVNQAVGKTRLPDNASTPVIRAGGGREPHLMFMSVSDKGLDRYDFANYVTNNIKVRLEHVEGVGTVDQFSSQNALRINLIPKKMAQFGLTVSQVVSTIRAVDQDVSVGVIVSRDQLLAMNLKSKPSNIAAFKSIIIKRSLNRIIRLKDIAHVAVGSATVDPWFSFYDGKSAAGIGISPAESANPIEVGKRVRAQVKRLQRTLPPGMKIHMAFDSSVYLQHSVDELFETIIEAVFFVGLVTFLFLGNVRLTFIPIVTIPVCIVTTAAVILVLGYSINIMTLLALVIAVGLVVDDAIVVLENAYRHIEKGESPMQAALSSMKEVTFPVIGMTLSIVAVYLPTAFMHGKTAVYFQQFSFTLAGAVLVSGFVALTLTPMMCARVMVSQGQSNIEKVIDGVFSHFRRAYQRFLAVLMQRRLIVMLIFTVLFGSGYFLIERLPTSLLPTNYVGMIMAVVSTPDSASGRYTERVNNQEVLPLLRRHPEVQGVMTFGGGNNAFNIITLKPPYRVPSKTQALATLFQQDMGKVVSANAGVMAWNINNMRNSGSTGEEFYLQGYVPIPELVKASRDFKTALDKTGLFVDTQNSLRYSSQQYDITINRTLAQQLNVPLANINATIATLLGGARIADGFSYGSILYDVMLQAPIKKLADLSILKEAFVPTDTSPVRLVNLMRLVSVTKRNALPQITHVDGQPSGMLSTTPKPTVPAGVVLSTLQSVAHQVLPAGVSLAYTQRMMDLVKGKHTSIMVFGLGIVFIYLIFSALFESFIDPLIILFTVPLCIVGALLFLFLINGTLNIYTDIALVTLIGLVSKHGVLITHFANQLREQGHSVKEAATQAASIRLRPILMTTATMVMGALPLVFATGSGSNGRIQVGTIIVSGLLFGTFFSLVVIPVVYTLVARWRSVKRDAVTE